MAWATVETVLIAVTMVVDMAPVEPGCLKSDVLALGPTIVGTGVFGCIELLPWDLEAVCSDRRVGRFFLDHFLVKP